ncbi:glycosyltransferase family 2 protein [candidate division KSB1 bacterium]
MSLAKESKKSRISLIVPGYNEEQILNQNLSVIFDYLKSLEPEYEFELIFINDGSVDKTHEISEKFVSEHPNCIVIHHNKNMKLGTALQTGFKHASGDYVISYDLDLSYSLDHIKRMLDTIKETNADLVIASPYMKGGKLTKVPYLRKILSKFVNRFMYFASQDKFSTFTGMVRTFDARFLKSLNLKAKDYEINPEIIYKSLILRAHVIEIPAHLDWSLQRKERKKSISFKRIFHGVIAGLMSGYIFRPYIFFMAIGFILFIVSLYIISWILINIYHVYPEIPVAAGYFDDRLSNAIAEVFRNRPHAFFIGGFTFLISLQLISIGFLSLQNKRYFEELFHISTTLHKHNQRIS